MSSPRRPGSTSRRRVAGQRSRSGSTANSTRIGLNRPEDSAEAVDEAATEEQTGATPDTETGATSAEETEDAQEQAAQADDATPGESDGSEVTAEPADEPQDGPVSTGKAGRAKRNGTTHQTTPGAGQDGAAQQPARSNQPDAERPGDVDEAQRAEGDPAEQSESDAEPATGGRGATKNLIAAMLVATVVLAGLAAWFGVEAYAVRNGNQALSDQATTSEVNGQISDGVEKIFSYDFADTGKTEQAAKDLLTGGAVGEYDKLFATVKEQAPIQKLVVTTTVKASSVTRLEGDRAEVLLFVDQNATRTDVGGQPSVGPAQVVINAEKHGDDWKIAQITQR
ncbi:hypothetical protein GCM10027271_15070 [Saccharopolyspora gloriosae]|uniref:Mce-associated membrane protein n=1 Tax=Saccharopolyspora gloriosae TaxID=455344 RepID=A0A840NCI6_9PSEU|nr:hypothetical protein [Saccharopolyspora gloriosae]MBB5067059.1 Mce-associated membrane protein [Saccharopolyspora gloriosae]